MTKDQGFMELVTRHGPPPQVSWLTCGNTINAALRVILAAAWSRLDQLLLEGEAMVEIGGRKRS